MSKKIFPARVHKIEPTKQLAAEFVKCKGMNKLTLKQRLRRVKGKIMLSVDDDDTHRYLVLKIFNFMIFLSHSDCESPSADDGPAGQRGLQIRKTLSSAKQGVAKSLKQETRATQLLFG